jgi:hypothetical protein
MAKRARNITDPRTKISAIGPVGRNISPQLGIVQLRSFSGAAANVGASLYI